VASDPTDIGNCFVTNFKHLFTSTNPLSPSELLDLFHPVISDLDNTILCSIPEEAEIYEALLSLGREKARGLDGFTTLFYVKHWDCIKSNVLQAIGNFFHFKSTTKRIESHLHRLNPQEAGPFGGSPFPTSSPS
jgi:hypothetical protein